MAKSDLLRRVEILLELDRVTQDVVLSLVVAQHELDGVQPGLGHVGGDRLAEELAGSLQQLHRDVIGAADLVKLRPEFTLSAAVRRDADEAAVGDR